MKKNKIKEDGDDVLNKLKNNFDFNDKIANQKNEFNIVIN
jgi:hypothetical protein